MGRGGGGGGGGRIRFRSSKSGHTPDQQDELGRQWRNGTTKFTAINSGCFYKSSGLYCPSRLTDFYCVMWSHGQQDDGSIEISMDTITTGTSVGNATSLAVSSSVTRQPLATTAIHQDTQLSTSLALDADICSGDFVNETIGQVNLILPVVLLAAGTLLNLLTGRIALRYCSRQLPICYYLAVLCVVDTILLHFRFVDLWLQSAFDIKLTMTLLLMDESACQLLTMLYSSLSHFKAMLQIAMAVDARRHVLQPLRCVERYSGEWVKNGLILMCVILVLINGHHLWSLAVVKENSVDRLYHCGWGPNWPVTELFTTWLWPLTDLLVGDLLPVGWVLFTACSGFRRLWQMCDKQQQKQQISSLTYHIIDVGLFQRVSATLLACSLAYAVLQSPGALHSCIMYAKFLAASLAAQASGARGLGHIYRPVEDDWWLYVGRVCSGLQPVVNSLLLLACVPQFRRDAARRLRDIWWRRRPDRGPEGGDGRLKRKRQLDDGGGRWLGRDRQQKLLTNV